MSWQKIEGAEEVGGEQIVITMCATLAANMDIGHVNAEVREGEADQMRKWKS